MATKLDAIRGLYTALERADMGGAFRFREVEEMAAELAKAGRALDRINLAMCNGIERWDSAAGRRLASWTDEDQARADRAKLRAADKALAVLSRLNGDKPYSKSNVSVFTVSFNGDPRGAAIKLFVAPDNPESGNASAYF